MKHGAALAAAAIDDGRAGQTLRQTGESVDRASPRPNGVAAEAAEDCDIPIF